MDLAPGSPCFPDRTDLEFPNAWELRVTCTPKALMCGIAGVITANSSGAERLVTNVTSMSNCLAHRGPDDSGVWTDPNHGVALGFRRLAIIDVSPAGHQPMSSASGRFTVIFNGEVYNYRELRRELEQQGCTFRGHSDTEVIVTLFERIGIQAAVRKFVGMFAIAAWDAQTRTLSLIRDRLGIKPLYYFHRPGFLAFGSELKAIASLPEFDRAIDASAVDAYLRYLYVPAPQTIYQHARKLLPGHILTIGDIGKTLETSIAYWSVEEAYAQGRQDPFNGSDAETVEELRRILSDAVQLRMRSDVPMGALLSGGIDSSTVVGLMQAGSTTPTRTFSIGFPGTAHDESEHAAAIARALGTNHTAFSVTGDDALSVVPLLPDMFDEPFADPSQIPTYLVCKLARQDVTVALSGDGGDEVFAGYERYIQGERLIGSLKGVAPAIRRMAGRGINSVSAASWERAYRTFAPLADRGGRHRLAGQKIAKLGNLLSQDTDGAMYRSLISAGWQDPPMARAPAQERSRVDQRLEHYSGMPLLDRMMLVDQETYLADDLLAKVDRASMAVSLEARVPLLDHRVIEFAWKLDRGVKIRQGRGKWALRQVLYGMVDPALVDRPKTGFSVPLKEWLRGPLKGWAMDLLFDANVRRDEWMSATRLKAAWTALERGDDAQATALWTAVMFEAWRRRWVA